MIECKGLKTNSEFRTASTEDDHLKRLTTAQAYNFLKEYINQDKERIYNKGYNTYLRAKTQWESANRGKTFPMFKWDKSCPGANSVDLTAYFGTKEKLREFIDRQSDDAFTESAFRNKVGIYKVLQTHEPSNRTDDETGIHQAAPLVSDFSVMAVDLFQRTGVHKFVFMNPEKISHSPTSPNHLYQNYIIDILIPGIKDELVIKHPWYDDLDECILKTAPKTVEYDASQIDYRDTATE